MINIINEKQLKSYVNKQVIKQLHNFEIELDRLSRDIQLVRDEIKITKSVR